ncbi:MAG TPA: DciA family protein [Moraxellaceae bacterium]|nr:DciA family protein [Moraxellaceae bacterium]
MRHEKTTTLSDILAQGRLGSLRERSSRIERLDTLLGFYLDQRLRQQVRVAGYQDGTLVLACANTTVAGQLRYLSRIYMQQLRQHAEFCDIGRIKAVIAPASPAAGKPRKPPRRLSPATADLLRALSEDLGGGEISEALQRLARHGDPAREGKPDRSS